MAEQPADGGDAGGAGELDRVLNVIGVVLLTASGVLAGLLELLLIPLYAGKTLVPITVLLAVLTNVALPRLARELVPHGPAMIAPFAGWLLVSAGLGLFVRPEGDVIIPGGGHGMEWTGWGVLLLGTLAGVVTIVVSLPKPA